MGLGEERDREECDDDPASRAAAREEQRHGESQRERELEDEVRGVPRTERGERRVRGDDEPIVVHAGERLVDEVRHVERDRDREESLHGRAMADMNSTTARSI